MTLMMSVSGVRGIVGRTMTPTLATELACAFGADLGGGRVVLARDSRPSGEMIRAAVAAGLLASGCTVIDLGVVTTPSAALMIGELGAVAGVVITASHNPIEWNGIKLLCQRGHALPAADAQRVYDRYHAKDFALRDATGCGRMERDGSTNERHVAKILTLLNVDAIRSCQYHVVLDSVNGAGGEGGRRLLEALGCKVTHLNAEPTGRFAHTPEPTAENLTGLCDAVKQAGADLGFAQDPDADRLAVVDDKSRYIGEEYTFALAAKEVFSMRPGPAAANLSTSRMIDDLAAQAGGGAIVHRTAVGEANVASAVLDKQCVIGGEGNGGVIDPRVVAVRDSFTGMGLVLNLLARTGQRLSSIVDAMPRYVMVKRKLEMPAAQIAPWLERVRSAAANDARVDTCDGVRIDWPQGWVHVRPSNTEPIARVIAEASDEATANELARRVMALR
ncbi:MAG: phosphoglucosamine mutase [Phycisphaerae bacterium]|nr:MAG: phosphoglucosamine mutase [Planctomycetia bacterium]RIK67558.1 MAG: phosphoglucosamine mutase [Planctomycetota bacterium]GJQ25003.1 MAG: phosphoglucosamine mutase [Phycisphaerae bacterium]